MASIDTIADRSTGSAVAGKAYFETSTNKFIIYNGSSWVEIDSDGTGVGNTNEIHYSGGLFTDSSAPYYISTAPEMHFDAAILDGADPANNPSDGTAVSTYGNRSGSATSYTATQSTASRQPLYKESGGLSFVQVGDGVTRVTKWMDLANSKSIGSSDDLTVIQVGKRTLDWYATTLTDSTKYGHEGAAYYLIGTNTHWLMGKSNSSSAFTSTDLNSLHILVSQRSGGSFSVWLNSGAAKLSGTSNTYSRNLDRLFQGLNTNAVQGDYYETLYFDSALSVSDMNIVRAYLANKYSIASSDFS